ncbi:MAG: ABC transporter ATP-binding protein [Clostridia bacterium]|nr:ABC transporter ATP-binding protein [Clostridia bacterium]MBQ5809169.1 ABC transporter ATP-binding protein [Clostridia bacterium]
MSEKKKNKVSLLKSFLPYYKKYMPMLIFDLFCASLTTVCELVLPMIVREITGRATEDFASLTVSLVLKCGVLYLVLRIIDTLANYYMASYGHIMGTKIETDMRHDFFAHLQKLSFSYYDSAKVGTLMSRITSDLFDITEFSHHGPEELFISSIKIVCSFVILCGMNVPLTLIVFAALPPMVISLAIFNRKLKDGFKESRKQVGELNSSVEDSLLGIRVVKSFAKEEHEQAKFDKGNERFLTVKKHVYKILGGFHSCTRLFDGLMYIIVVVAGAIFLINGGITAADYIAYLLFVTTLTTSIRRIVEFAEQFQRGMTGIERFAEIMAIEPDITDATNARVLDDVKGNVSFKDVAFRYAEGDKDVLSHLSLDVKAGESIALVGPSGGGKTTLCSLIPRFYEVTSGTISVDGTDIKDVTLASLRSNIGVVQQDVYLFSGSVRENIAYGKADATDEQIREAARLAGADEFISQLPDGYDTYVGERGVKLSGGQKQRISIARVFLKDPPILILDEATSALDNESERLVQKSLEVLAKGRTTFTIAHRLTTIKNADRILVLTENGIEESGTHSELIAAGGKYAELYSLYTIEC